MNLVKQKIKNKNFNSKPMYRIKMVVATQNGNYLTYYSDNCVSEERWDLMDTAEEMFNKVREYKETNK